MSVARAEISIAIQQATALDLLRNRVETERMEVIPLGKVLTEQALIDDSHAAELGASMEQKRGQITPIAVRARLKGADEIVYDVIDGFHRSEGRKRKGRTDIQANVLYGCSDEEMYDLRILAASSVKSVQFPRIVEWVSKSWDTTRWAKKGLSVTQAFVKTIGDREKTRNTSGVRLSSEELDEVKDWVNAKCKRWGKSVWSVYKILTLISEADPSLVRQVRSSEGTVKDREGKITPARLKAVVEVFPGRWNFAVQRALLRVSVEKRLTAEETEILVNKFKDAKLSEMSEDQIYRLASKFEVKREVVIYDAKTGKKDSGNGNGPHKDRVEPPSDSETPTALKKRIVELTKELQRVKESKGAEMWWRKKDYLTPMERDCMERVMYKNEDVGTFCKEKGIAQVQLWGFIRSAFAKRHALDHKQVN